MQGTFKLSMWLLRFSQLFASENTSANLSNVCLSFFDKQVHVFDNLQQNNNKLANVLC